MWLQILAPEPGHPASCIFVCTLGSCQLRWALSFPAHMPPHFDCVSAAHLPRGALSGCSCLTALRPCAPESRTSPTLCRGSPASCGWLTGVLAHLCEGVRHRGWGLYPYPLGAVQCLPTVRRERCRCELVNQWSGRGMGGQMNVVMDMASIM